MQRERHFLARVEGVVHEHGIAHVDEQRGFAHGRILDPMHREIIRRDPQGFAFLAFFQRVQQRFTDIDIERVAILVFFGLFHAVALGAAR